MRSNRSARSDSSGKLSSICHLCPAGLLNLSRGTFKLVPRDKLKVPRDKFKSPATFKNTPCRRCIILIYNLPCRPLQDFICPPREASGGQDLARLLRELSFYIYSLAPRFGCAFFAYFVLRARNKTKVCGSLPMPLRNKAMYNVQKNQVLLAKNKQECTCVII